MGVQTPELVIETILRYLPVNGRLSTRLISSAWNSVVMRRFRREPHRVVLRGKADFKNFLETFNPAENEVPIKRYVLSPAAADGEDFLAFASQVGPQITELSADCLDTDTNVYWGRRKWQTGERTKLNFDNGDEYFKQLDHLLQNTPNLEYLGIMQLKLGALNALPVETASVYHLPKLRIFARVPSERCSAWCDSLVEQAPLLQGAKEFQADSSILDGRDFNLSEPQLVNGYPLRNSFGIWIKNTKDLENLENNLKRECQYPVYIQIHYTPNSVDEKKDFRFPFHPFSTVSDLYYNENTLNHPTLYIQNGQFPALRRLCINVSSKAQREFPFQSCELPTVEDLTLSVKMASCVGWNLGGIFPNIRKLTIYFRDIPPQFQLRDLLDNFHGSESLETLVVEDVYRNNDTQLYPPTRWEELLGLGRNHICEQRRIPGFFPMAQNTCSIPNCKGGQGLVFPALKTIDFDHLVLDEFLPLFIRSIRYQSFPALEKVSLGGEMSKNYCPTEVPNVEDYKIILESMVNEFKLEIGS